MAQNRRGGAVGRRPAAARTSSISQCWNLQVVVEKRQSCKKWQSAFGSRAVCGCFIRRKCTSSQHRCAPRASMHASFVTCGQYRVSGTGSTEKSAGAGGEESESFGASSKRGASGSTSSSPVSGTEADTPGATRASRPCSMPQSLRSFSTGQSLGRASRGVTPRGSRRPRAAAKRARRENKRTSFFQQFF